MIEKQATDRELEAFAHALRQGMDARG